MKLRRKLLMSIVAVIGLMTLMTSAAFAQDPDAGKIAWEETLCQRCHGEMGEGVYGSPTAGPTDASLAEWIEQVRTPRRRMPAFSAEQISDEMIGDMYAYMTGLDTPAENNFQRHEFADDAHPGAVLMAEKRCVACHGLNGPIRGYNNRAEMPTVDVLVTQIRTPRNRMPSYNESQISDEEIAAITDFLASQFSPQVQAVPSAAEKAVAALGGQEALQGLSTLTVEASGVRWVMDEGFEPGGDVAPIGPFTSVLSYDIASGNLRVDHTKTTIGQERAISEIIIGDEGYLDGQDARFGNPSQSAMTSDRWAAVIKQHRLLNPHLILQDVLADPSLASDAGEVLFDGAVHHRVDVAGGVAPLTLYIHAGTGQLAKLSTWESNPLRRDVSVEVFYYGWGPIGADGLSFPNEVYIAYDGEIVHKEIRSAISVNPELDAGLFTAPADVTYTFDADLAARGDYNHQYIHMFTHYGFPRDGFQTNVAAIELDEGVYHLTGGSHHSIAVEQADGIVILEAPLDEVRSQAIMTWLDETFPDKAVTYAVASHHHVDHSAGLRAFAAAGATIVVHESAEDLFAEALSADSTVVPDGMGSSSASIAIVPADGSFTIDDDSLAVEVYPIAQTHAEDMVIPYVAGAGVVFVSDLYSPNPEAESAGAGGEIVGARIAELGLDVATIVGGHGGTIDIETFESILGN